jgi:hypothetical protein
LAVLELWKAAKKCLTTFFGKLKKGGRFWNQPDFSAKLCFWLKIMDDNRIFRKICENGVANL